MKIKSIIFMFFVVIMVIIIYKINIDNKIYYVNIDAQNKSDYSRMILKNIKKNNKLEKYVNSFSKKDYRVTDLIRDIEDNKKINNQTIQNALIKSDVLTIRIGINDINYKIVNNNKEEIYKYSDEVLDDIDKLLKLIRIYSKEKIYILKIENKYGISYEELFLYINKRLEEICEIYDVQLVSLEYLQKKYK